MGTLQTVVEYTVHHYGAGSYYKNQNNNGIGIKLVDDYKRYHIRKCGQVKKKGEIANHQAPLNLYKGSCKENAAQRNDCPAYRIKVCQIGKKMVVEQFGYCCPVTTK
jgi:hypothetical protein